ncbi:MAG: adenylate/guanylate cyclase domain-containing protein, partial [Proteobacteria bacterium]|nr:adenylate/guanylate cyclase domain-containing protein [Pseudomonadota bacterium]
MFKTPLVRNLVLLSLAGNLAGDIDIFSYILFYGPINGKDVRLFSPVSLAGVLAFYVAGFLFAWLYTRPVDRFLAGAAPEEETLAKRRSLNFPTAAAAAWTVLWVLGALFYLAVPWVFGKEPDLAGTAHMASSVVSGGLVTVVFVYFVLDLAVARWLAPRVLAGLPATRVPGVRQASLRGKMTLYYFATVVMLVAIMAGSFAMAAMETGGDGRLPLLPMVLAMASWAILVGSVFLLLLSRQITRPVLNLMAAMEQVRNGDTDIRIPVVTADEMGQVAEGFNRMVKSVAERDFIRETFGRYVTRQVSEAVLNGRLSLGGETREVTILLCDIRDFTAMSEGMTPAQVVELLNGYFAEMVEVILDTGGTLDKFMGDSFLAVYGAPLPMEGHALAAARAALGLRGALARVNAARKKNGQPAIRCGISLHTGEVVAGNIGSQRRMEYTVIGDAVNTASRIEGLNRVFATDILMSEATWKKVRGEMNAAPMPP